MISPFWGLICNWIAARGHPGIKHGWPRVCPFSADLLSSGHSRSASDTLPMELLYVSSPESKTISISSHYDHLYNTLGQSNTQGLIKAENDALLILSVQLGVVIYWGCCLFDQTTSRSTPGIKDVPYSLLFLLSANSLYSPSSETKEAWASFRLPPLVLCLWNIKHVANNIDALKKALKTLSITLGLYCPSHWGMETKLNIMVAI